jgi:hypothetical protein
MMKGLPEIRTLEVRGKLDFEHKDEEVSRSPESFKGDTYIIASMLFRETYANLGHIGDLTFEGWIDIDQEERA